MFRKLLSVLSICFLMSAPILSGCGRKGAPKPPEENAPLSVQFLSASGQVNAVVLKWTAPKETASGAELKDLANFVIQRRDVVGEKTGSFEDVGVVQVDKTLPLKNRQFSFADTAVQPGRTYEYLIFGTMDDGLEGESDKILRITFRGQTSTVEREGALPPPITK